LNSAEAVAHSIRGLVYEVLGEIAQAEAHAKKSDGIGKTEVNFEG